MPADAADMESFVPIKAGGHISPTQPAIRNLWTAGTLLRATVLDAASAGRVQLQVGHHAVQARTGLNLQAGQTLHLRVSHAGELTVLQAKADPPTGTSAASVTRSQIEGALRQALPRQQSMTGLLANLQQAVSTGVDLDAPTVAAARAFLNQLPGLKQLRSAGGMAELIARSGITHEASGTVSRPGGSTDLKGALLRLIGQLVSTTPTPAVDRGPATTSTATATLASRPETLPPLREGAVQGQPRAMTNLNLQADPGLQLLRQAEAALARVQLSQLASVPVEDSSRQLWTFELALRADQATPTVIQFRVEKEPGSRPSSEAPEDERWSVSIGLDLDALGPVEARVSVLGERVSASLRAHKAETSQLINEHLSNLREAISGRGLQVDCVSCRQGLSDKRLHLQAHLIEVRA